MRLPNVPQYTYVFCVAAEIFDSQEDSLFKGESVAGRVQPEASWMGVGGRACGLTQDGLPLAWEVYSSVVNDKYVGGGGVGIDQPLWLGPRCWKVINESICFGSKHNN